MGKKRVVAKAGVEGDKGAEAKVARGPKKKFATGTLHIKATYNNTQLSLTDPAGNVLAWATSGALGFKGAKKGTTFAASKVGETIAEKAEAIGIKEVDVVVRGVGSGRESAIRAFVARGISINALKDATPVPFNGPKPKKPRRV
mgnify:FL=1